MSTPTRPDADDPIGIERDAAGLSIRVASTMPLGPPDRSVVEPVYHPFVERYYARMPQVYRTMDVRQRWTLKRWLAGMLTACTEMDDILTAMWGARPVGPAHRTPWPVGMSPAELQAWINARQFRTSGLGDPYTARTAWLPWLAQIVGVALPPGATDDEARDIIRFATSGWHAGNPASMSAAARSALTGSRFSRVLAHWRPDTRETGIAATPWDLTVITRTSETPDPGAVLRAIAVKGVKPAGTVLHHVAYEAPWDVIEALRPTWLDWERTRNPDGETFHPTTWTELEETGLSFADVPGQKLDNASFERGVASWVTTGGSIEPVSGGIDGFGAARLTALGQVNEGFERVNLIPDPSFEVGVGRVRIATVRTGVVASPVTSSNEVIPPDGARYGYINITSDDTGGDDVTDVSLHLDPVPVIAGQTYRCEIALNCTGGDRGRGHVGVQWLDADGVVLTDGGIVNGPGAPSQRLPASTLWRTVGMSALAPPAADALRLTVHLAVDEPGTTRTVRFDAALVETVETYDGTWFAGRRQVPRSTPGINLGQNAAKTATFRENYRAALNLRPVSTPVRLRAYAAFRDNSGTVVDQQIAELGSYPIGPWRRSATAEFRTGQFATSIDVEFQFRDMTSGGVVEVDATELRAHTGGI